MRINFFTFFQMVLAQLPLLLAGWCYGAQVQQDEPIECAQSFGDNGSFDADLSDTIDPKVLRNSDNFIAQLTQFNQLVSRKEHVYFVADDLSHYRVAVETTIERNNIRTTILNYETRLFIPQELIDDLMLMPNREKIPFGILQRFVAMDGIKYSPHLYRELVEELNRAGYLEQVKTTAKKIAEQGKRHSQEIAAAGLEYYLEQIQRRDWPEKMKAGLVDEFWDTLEHSFFSISRVAKTGKIVGTLQTIRSPHGVLVVFEKPHGVNSIAKFYGKWGASYRRLAPISPVDRITPDLELFKQMPYQHERLFRVPVERKMLANGLNLPRALYTQIESQRNFVRDGQSVYDHWGAGEIDEHARLSVDPELNPTMFANVYLQLFALAIDMNFPMHYNLLYRHYYTYNDYPSLYNGAGYEPNGQTITVEGKEFQILFTTGQDHIRALLEFRHRVDPQDKAVLERLKKFYADYGHKNYTVNGKRL